MAQQYFKNLDKKVKPKKETIQDRLDAVAKRRNARLKAREEPIYTLEELNRRKQIFDKLEREYEASGHNQRNRDVATFLEKEKADKAAAEAARLAAVARAAVLAARAARVAAARAAAAAHMAPPPAVGVGRAGRAVSAGRAVKRAAYAARATAAAHAASTMGGFPPTAYTPYGGFPPSTYTPFSGGFPPPSTPPATFTMLPTSTPLPHTSTPPATFTMLPTPISPSAAAAAAAAAAGPPPSYTYASAFTTPLKHATLLPTNIPSNSKLKKMDIMGLSDMVRDLGGDNSLYTTKEQFRKYLNVERDNALAASTPPVGVASTPPFGVSSVHTSGASAFTPLIPPPITDAEQVALLEKYTINVLKDKITAAGGTFNASDRYKSTYVGLYHDYLKSKGLSDPGPPPKSGSRAGSRGSPSAVMSSFTASGAPLPPTGSGLAATRGGFIRGFLHKAANEIRKDPLVALQTANEHKNKADHFIKSKLKGKGLDKEKASNFIKGLFNQALDEVKKDPMKGVNAALAVGKHGFELTKKAQELYLSHFKGKKKGGALKGMSEKDKKDMVHQAVLLNAMLKS